MEQSLKQFIAKHKITLSFEDAASNPYMIDQDSDWNRRALHYRILLKRPGCQFTSYYSMGCGLSRDPTCQDVLDSLRGEAESIECEGTFESWAQCFGYNEDSIKALNSWKVSKKLSFKFIRFLGSEAWQDLKQTDRL